ncbi:MAG: hypothetical protein ABI472_24020 [Ginsengibacter sp.]
MNLPRCEYLTERKAELFKFTSIGPNGEVKKLVVYSEMLENDIYNLAFGDYNEDTNSIDDKIITNNSDSQKILATVASTLYVFTNKHPNVWVYASGSNKARTRLYRMEITTNLEAILPDFQIFGLQNDIWNEFERGQEYEAFLVKQKMS